MFRLIATIAVAVMPIISVATDTGSSGFGSKDVDILDDYGCQTPTCDGGGDTPPPLTSKGS